MTDLYCEQCFRTDFKKFWLDENGGVYCSEECLAESKIPVIVYHLKKEVKTW